MNIINLTGSISSIQPSHSINGIEYEKANLISTKPDGKEDLIQLKFKKDMCPYREHSTVSLSGQIRSYSRPISEDKNKVDIYVYTSFDYPDDINDYSNEFELDGRICKMQPLRKVKGGTNLQFILANNIVKEELGVKLSNYLPCIAWNKLAYDLALCDINDHIKITGELHFRLYKKYISEDEVEVRQAHELLVKGVTI